MNSSWVFEATEQDFEEKVLNQSREVPVVVDFWAPWCAPCRSLAPALEKLVQQREGTVLLAKVNIDNEQALAYRFNVQSIPLVIGIRDGKVVAEFLGLVSEKQMEEFLDRLRPSPAEQLAKQARELEETNPAEAEKAYRQALKDDPEQAAAVLGLCRILLAQGKVAEAGEFLEKLLTPGELGEEKERLEALVWLRLQAAQAGEEAALRSRLEKGKDAEARFGLGCVLAAREQYEEGLNLFLEAGELDRKLLTSKVKEAMVKVFHVVGVRSPLADDYRQRLTGLLY